MKYQKLLLVFFGDYTYPPAVKQPVDRHHHHHHHHMHMGF